MFRSFALRARFGFAMSHFGFPRLRASLPFVVFMTFCAGPVWAHNPDTSYVHVRLTEDWIETRFTFDLDVLERVTPLDQNGDGKVVEFEFRTAEPEIRRALRGSVLFEINEFSDDFGAYEPAIWPENIDAVPYAERGVTLVHFPFRKRVQELPESVALTFTIAGQSGPVAPTVEGTPQQAGPAVAFFELFGDRHTVLGTFEEPPLPEYEVVFTWELPDFLYFTEVDALPQNRMLEFLKLGMEHIFLGYDHILFLLALVVVDRFRTLLKIITSFTVAHTITLVLATLDVISLPSRLIESAIAMTIMYVALENLWTKNTSHRWVLTFFFGLVHGFGFANVLREMQLPTSGLVRCLVSFNVGVELGQICIVCAIWPLWRLLQRRAWGKKAAKGLSVVIFLFGFAWFADRAFTLGLMPF